MAATECLSLSGTAHDGGVTEPEAHALRTGFDGELLAAIDWVDTAFGEIDRAWPRLRPFRGLSAALRRGLRRG